jgi:hypothetical protein
MSSARLDALTPDLFDIVLQDLRLNDIRQLRLVSKETCARATQDRFLSITARKSVKITPEGLDTFARMTSQGYRLGYSVKHLTLVGVLYDLSILEGIIETGALSWLPMIGPGREALKQLSEEELITARKYFDEISRRKEDSEEFHEAGKDLDLLSRAMRNIASEPHHKLDTLSLEVAVADGGAVAEMSPQHKSPARYSKSRREQIFQIASETFRLVSLALREVEPSIRHLEVFNGQTGPPYKLPYDVFGQIDWMGSKDSWPSFRALKALTLCVSDRAVSPDLQAFESNSARDAASWNDVLQQELETDARHISRIVQMQSLCPQLEDLRILWYRTLPGGDWMRLARRYPGLQAHGREPSGCTWPRTTGKAQW